MPGTKKAREDTTNNGKNKAGRSLGADAKWYIIHGSSFNADVLCRIKSVKNECGRPIYWPGWIK
jgi:hypothetical protein